MLTETCKLIMTAATLICLTGMFIAMPKEATLGAKITKNLTAYKNRSL